MIVRPDDFKGIESSVGLCVLNEEVWLNIDSIIIQYEHGCISGDR